MKKDIKNYNSQWNNVRLRKITEFELYSIRVNNLCI